MKTLLVLLFFAAGVAAKAQPAHSFPLWPAGAPDALGHSENDTPTLTPFLPAKGTGAAMVICPGGSYEHLAEHEGKNYAGWLAQNGITAFVLKYRLGSHGYRHPAMLHDAARAVRLVRAHSADWHIDPHRIGIIGSSAGGHLAATLLTHFDAGRPDDSDPVERVSSRPDLGILCYPVITMGSLTHQGSKDYLLGKNPSPELVLELSDELHVTRDTPPCFIWHTFEDTTVPVENSLCFAESLRKFGVPFELHIYQKGAHGMGLGSRKNDPASWHPWVRDCTLWLSQQGFTQ